MCVHVQGGVRTSEIFALAIRRKEGTLRLEGDYIPEILPPRLSGTREPGRLLVGIEVSATSGSRLADLRERRAGNVASLYAAVATALRGGAYSGADFGHAARLRELIEAVAE